MKFQAEFWTNRDGERLYCSHFVEAQVAVWAILLPQAGPWLSHFLNRGL